MRTGRAGRAHRSDAGTAQPQAVDLDQKRFRVRKKAQGVVLASFQGSRALGLSRADAFPPISERVSTRVPVERRPTWYVIGTAWGFLLASVALLSEDRPATVSFWLVTLKASEVRARGTEAGAMGVTT